jgi:hypothetical protein
MNDDEIHPYDIRTNEEWRRLGAVAENRPTIKVNPAEVPEQFRQLIPYVERWAIGCDVTRGDYMEKQPQADVDDFYQTVLPFREAIHNWMLESPQTEAKTYFIIMLAAHCEACPPPSPEEIAAKHRQRAEEREAKREYWRDIARKSQNDPNA